MNRKQRRAEKSQSRSPANGALHDVQTALDAALRLHQAGRLSEAEPIYRQILAANPQHADSLHLLGMIAYQVGRHDAAVELIGNAIEVSPKVAYYHSNLGLALGAQGKLDEAIACHRRALALDPGNVEANNNLGNALKELRRLDEAIACYRRALALKPDMAEVHYNLGNALRDQGKPGEALTSYRQALVLKPDYTDALNSLAMMLIAQGQANVALNAVKLSLQLKDAADTRQIFVDCIKNTRVTSDDGVIQAAVIRALTEPWCRPTRLARVGADLLRLDPDIGACVARAAGAWPRRLSAQDLFGPNGLAALAGSELLHAMLCSTPIPDAGMERFLTLARRAVLDAAEATESIDGADAGLRFFSALARQCFINEYVFSHADDEIQKANSLRDKLAAALAAGTPVPALWVAAVAAYMPLSSIPQADRLLDMQWPAPVTAVLEQQLREPARERQLRAAIPQLTKIEDEVSRLVRSQYEENPYPRWVKTEPARNSYGIVAHLHRQFPHVPIARHSDNEVFDLLIAGCGTGQQSIEMAQMFKTARILAVDLSLGSLGYARRKTQEMAVTSIDYAQADLLELGSIGRQFDAITSAGVLHHLADPLAGWRVLLSLLRPGGFMNLGFYSELARRDIVKAQAFVAENGLGGTPDAIRQGRQLLMDPARTGSFGTVTNLFDFYSTSMCRDLLFHAQEHLITLPGIAAFLKDNNLTFLGFDIDRRVLHAYRQRFPDDLAATNLANWQIFETENPDTFTGMYQFWIQKVG